MTLQQAAQAARHWSRSWAVEAERLTRAVQRNPRGWETWLALQADVAAERYQEHMAQKTRSVQPGGDA